MTLQIRFDLVPDFVPQAGPLPKHSRQPEEVVTDSESGSASIWVLAAAGVVGFATLVAVTQGAIQTARVRAAAAADLVALAGAQDLLTGDPCQRAAAAAELNRARLADCRVAPDAITVTVSVPVVLPGVGTRQVSSRSRAGPVR
jgi:secretion/DNA translocation related TadE-like protein